MKRPGIVNQLYFSMAQKLLPAKPKAAPDHLFVLQVQHLGDGNVGGGGSGFAVVGGCGNGKGLIALCVKLVVVRKCYNRQKLLKQNLSDILSGAMFNLECTTFRPYGPTMAILDPKIAIFGLIWP